MLQAGGRVAAPHGATWGRRSCRGRSRWGLSRRGLTTPGSWLPPYSGYRGYRRTTRVSRLPLLRLRLLPVLLGYYCGTLRTTAPAYSDPGLGDAPSSSAYSPRGSDGESAQRASSALGITTRAPRTSFARPRRPIRPTARRQLGTHHRAAARRRGPVVRRYETRHRSRPVFNTPRWPRPEVHLRGPRPLARQRQHPGQKADRSASHPATNLDESSRFAR